MNKEILLIKKELERIILEADNEIKEFEKSKNCQFAYLSEAEADYSQAVKDTAKQILNFISKNINS